MIFFGVLLIALGAREGRAAFFDFEAPAFGLGTEYGATAGHVPGDVVFAASDVEVAVAEFTIGAFVGFNVAQISGHPGPPVSFFPVATNPTQSLTINNINMLFDFRAVPADVREVAFDYVDCGGSENFEINGLGRQEVLSLSALGPVPGFAVNVSEGPAPCGVQGRVEIVADPGRVISSVLIGGQEFGIDNLASAEEPIAFSIDHFKVYDIIPEDRRLTEVFLVDRFGEGAVEIGALTRLATPVSKAIPPERPSGELIAPDEHLAWYEFFEEQPARVITVLNQFGRADWQTGNGRFLLVPAIKDRDESNGGIRSNQHFKCYEAIVDRDEDGVPDVEDNCPDWVNPEQLDRNRDGTGDACQCGDCSADGLINIDDILCTNSVIFGAESPGPCDATGDGICNIEDILAVNRKIFAPELTLPCERYRTVNLEDQFGLEVNLPVGAGRYFCNAAEKNQEGPPRFPNDHLACYDIPRRRYEGVHTLDDQFGNHPEIVLENQTALCVPSRSRLLSNDLVIDADGTASPGDGVPRDIDTPLGARLSDFPVQGVADAGLDWFDNDSDGQWTPGEDGDDLHSEDPATCPTAIRDSDHDLGADCKVLDLNSSLVDGQAVDCDLEVNAGFTEPHVSSGGCPSALNNIRYHDANGDLSWDDGEDIILDVNGNGVFD
jgi:hypothetical protein